MSSFTVTAASRDVKLDNKGTASVTFTVTNTSKKPVRAIPKLKPLGMTVDKWLTLPTTGARDFSPEESQQLVVAITIPPGVKEGDYSFGLNISNQANPDDDFSEGPAVAFKVQMVPAPAPKKSFPWWILIVVGVVLLGGGVTIALLLKPAKTTVPNLVGKPIDEASNLLAKAELRLEITETLATGTNRIGTVLHQEPKAEEKAGKDSVVRLAIEKERDKVKVPALIGLPASRLKELYGQLALNYEETAKRYDSRDKPGTILDQNPKDGAMVEPGSKVSLTVAGDGVEVPNVSANLKVQDAVNSLLARKLTVGTINQRSTTNTQLWDRVIDQEPKFPARIAPNSPVTLYVGVRAPRSHAIFLQDLRVMSPALQRALPR